MRRGLICLIVLGLVGGAHGGGDAPANAQGFQPSCSAATSRIDGGKYDTAFRLRCNFRVLSFRVRTSRDSAKVGRTVTLIRPDPEDRLRCGRPARRLMRCRGEVGRDVLIKGRLAVRGDPCSARRLRTFFRAEGGADCDPPGVPCIDIAYSASARDKSPSGC